MTFLRGCGGRVVQAYPKVKCVLESKWVGKNALGQKNGTEEFATAIRMP
jgi:hypothetical protein